LKAGRRDEIRVGHNVFVNQNCTFYDLGGLAIADDVMIGPNLSIITAGHPLEPSQRRAATIRKPIVIEKNVWIAAGAIIIGGVTVGENSVVAAGSVVTKDVPPNTFVGGNPARVTYAFYSPVAAPAYRAPSQERQFFAPFAAGRQSY
jgi:acetyltransferase-like isoleucine patch superfamily enzyme